MTTSHFRSTIIGLFVVALGMLGILSFEMWNQQVDHGPPTRDSFGQRDSGGSEEASEDKSAAKTTEGTQADTKASASTKATGRDRARSEKGDKANAEKSAKADSKAAEGGRSYEVDIDSSRVFVKVGSATRLGHPHGVEAKLKSGKITLGAGGELAFDMKSFKADTQEARKKVGLEGKKISDNEAKKVNETMRSADVLDVEKFPTAVYKIIAIKPSEKQEAGAPGVYEVNGRFTLHGAEQPLKFKAKLEQTKKEGALKLIGSFIIKQTAYGMTPYSAAGGLAKVADELEIVGELTLGSEK
jgi:polyisoprenoid-binding protein YceI